MSDWQTRPHRRLNLLTGEWILVSPHRLQRPWQGEVSLPAMESRPAYDPACYLCPGNERANGERNPAYEGTFVFDNDFAALLPDTGVERYADGDLIAYGEAGRCRVLCFSPRHDLDVAQMSTPQIRAVIDALASQYAELGKLPYVNAVTVFENRGALMGASNPHPHCQIWAESSLPNELAKETKALAAYLERHGQCLLCTYVEQEIAQKERLIYDNGGAAVIVPFWSTWPYEALVVARGHAGSLAELAGPQRNAFADAMRDLTSRYDRLFSVPFPYSMGFHQQPTDREVHEHWHMHAHYYPPLLRSASVRKFMVGYEMLGQPQRDFTPEQAAQRLREV
jgi:UDPglucose--hexose-1-phosphate uridylyltransferase